MERIERTEQDWSETLRKVHPEEHITKFQEACARLEVGQTTYTLDEDNFESKESFAAAEIAGQACLTAVKKVIDIKEDEESKEGN